LRWRDGRENPDTFQALLEYPKGFLVELLNQLRNDSPSFTRFMGKKSTLMNIGAKAVRDTNWSKRKKSRGQRRHRPDESRKIRSPPWGTKLPPIGIETCRWDT